MTKKTAVLVSALFLLLASCATAAPPEQAAATLPDAAQLQKMIDRFAPTEMRVNLGNLSAGDREALVKLIEAARVIDNIFLVQRWSGNPAEQAKLERDHSALGRARLHYFRINKGPWSELEGYTAFVPDVPPRKPLGANFYPEDMSKQEFQTWVDAMPAQERNRAEGFFTVVRRNAEGKLTLVPYSQEYAGQLKKAARLLHEAAALTDNATLKTFLNARADAFLSNDYYASDVAWMDLDAPLDITIGPYETYNDELFGFKAAFEAYINLRDDQETARLKAYSDHLQEIEDHLPIDPKFRNPKLGGLAPIRVVNEVFGAGDGNHAVQTAAYNLPNDERVVAEKGAKRVMMRNVQEAKFNKVLLPIAARVLTPAERGDVSFDWFFAQILAHELSHGLGPQNITVGGRATTVRQELKELYGTIEEAKADVTSLFALDYWINHGGLPGRKIEDVAAAKRGLYTTFLASSFRSVRFGIHEAHGRGMALQVNYLLDKGGFVVNPDGTFAVDFDKIEAAVRDLDHDLLTLEATGDYAGAKKMLTELAVIRPPMQKALDKLSDIPTDIEPIFVTADAVAPANGSSAPEAKP